MPYPDPLLTLPPWLHVLVLAGGAALAIVACWGGIQWGKHLWGTLNELLRLINRHHD